MAARAGYDFVGLRIIPLNLPDEPIHPLVTDAPLRRRTLAALNNTGVQILDVELARILPDQDVGRYLPALECAADLGARHVLSSAWCADRNFVRDQFCRLCEIAQPLHLTVDFEFVTFASYANLPFCKYLDNKPVASVEQFPIRQGEASTRILLELIFNYREESVQEIIEGEVVYY